uniref:FA complementation group I n=1 Tax=Gadus morhua TaxID=8049 RepID=A0A8C5A9N6_GADMO
MDKILSLSEGGDGPGELQQYLSSLSNDQLIKVLTNAALKGKNIGATIKGIFKGSPHNDPKGSGRRLLLYQHFIPLCESGDLQSEVAADIIGLLMLEVKVFFAPNLSGACLAEVASHFVEAIKSGKMASGKSLELFPSVLTALAACESLSFGKGELSGEEYKKQLINSLCSSRDVPLSPEELQFLLEKVLRMFGKLELQEVPPLIYQLLLLSAKGCKKQVLDGIIGYFNEQDLQQKDEQESMELEVQAIPKDQLRHVEGTAILHIVFAIRLDHDLGREFLKSLKLSYGDLCPFGVALLLSVARIQRYEDQVRGGLHPPPPDIHITQLCLDLHVPDCVPLALASVFGWDHVTQGLVQLGFFLMDTFGPKPGPFGKPAESGPSGAARTPNQQACLLGRQVLLEGFKMHEPIRGEILEQVLNRLVTKTASPVHHYIDLFSDIVVSAPMILLESASKVTETFDNLSYLPLATVQGLLKAVQPLLKVSMSLKDSLILVLRKAMFSSQLDGRKSAVTGFLLLLKNFKVLGSLASSQASQGISSSQIQVDVHSRYNSAANEAFCLEILSGLRRCLGQQADVRLMLYEGFYDVLRRNSQLASSIMQTLLSQLRRYYEPEQDLMPPVKLEPCITAQGDQVFLQEPLGHLLSCTVHSLLWLQSQRPLARPNDSDDEEAEDDEEGGYKSELMAILDSVTRRLVKSELEDFELDKSAEFSTASSVGVKNSIYAVLVMGVYEVLLEYNFIKANYSKSGLEELLELFQRYQKLAEILKEKSGKGRTSAKPPRSLLSMGFVSKLLTTLFRDSTLSREEGLSVLRSSPDFLRYALAVALQKIQQLEDSGHTDGPDGHAPDKAFGFLCDLTGVLMWRYTNIPGAVEAGGKKEKRCSLSQMCLEGLLRIFTTCTQRYPDRTAQLVSVGADATSDDPEPNADDITEISFFYIRQFQRSLFNQLSGLEEEFNSKEAQLLISILSVLSRQLEPSSQQFVSMITWTVKICKETSFEDIAFTKGLLSLLFGLHALYKSPVSLMLELCQDIHSQMGDIDQVRCVLSLPIKRFHHKPFIVLLILAQADKVLDEVDWLIAKKKADRPSAAPPQDPVEKAMTVQLGTLLTALNELVQTALLPGGGTDTLLRALSRTYTTLTTLVKYSPSLVQWVSHRVNVSLLQVRLSGSHLTPQCYSFITFVQAKLLRETKAIPNLIFSIEQYEKFLITLSKKSKVNLMQYMKLSTSRDFRINAATLEAALQEQDATQQDTPPQPQKKKRKKK